MSSELTQEGDAWSRTRQSALLGVSIVFLISSNLAVPARIWAQKRAYKRGFAEDYLLIVALLFTDVVTVSSFLATHYGSGVDLEHVEAQDLTYRNPVTGFTCEWITAVGNGFSLGATKVAILVYYRRLFMVNQKWLRVWWKFNFAFVLIWIAICAFFYIFDCTPINYYWELVNPDPDVKGLICLNHRLGFISIPLILGVISDFTIMLLSIFTVSTLKVRPSRRPALAAVFCVGVVCFACGLVRVIALSSHAKWDVVSFQLLNVAKLNMAVLCACVVPIFAQLRLVIWGGSETISSYRPESRGRELRSLATKSRSYPGGSAETNYDDSRTKAPSPSMTGINSIRGGDGIAEYV